MDYAHFKCTSHMVTPMTPSYDEQQMPVAAPISQSTSEESTSTASSSASSAPVVAAAATTTICITGQQQQFDNIEYRYHIRPRIIGRGHQGTVHECIDRTTGRRFAVKSIRKSDPAVERSQLSCEIELLREMKHPGIVRLVDVFEDVEYVHLVTDLYEGGELFDKIVEKSSSNDDDDNDSNNTDSVCFAEDEAARIMHQLLAAVSYMHERDVVHRDIKAENILFETEHEHSPVRIIDFGLSRKHRSSSGGCCRRQRQRQRQRRQQQQQQQQRPMTKAVGTPYYIAPEVLRRRYDRSCDIWSLGIIAYVLLCGYPPFNGETDDETHRSILRGEYGFPPEEWSGVSSEARDFIDGMLRMDPRERMTAEEALVHPWIARHHHHHHHHRVVVASERMMMLEEECHDSCVEVVYRESIGKQHRSQSRGGSTTRKDGMSVFGFAR